MTRQQQISAVFTYSAHVSKELTGVSIEHMHSELIRLGWLFSIELGVYFHAGYTARI